jgi:hypothetical protein
MESLGTQWKRAGSSILAIVAVPHFLASRPNGNHFLAATRAAAGTNTH